MKPKVAFIIVCWNNQDLLADCFKSIAEQTYTNHTTIMVDNGSKDESVKVAEKLAPQAEIIATGQNNGFAKGNNIGIKRALEDPAVKYVALINTDARLDKNWLERLVEFAANKPTVACLQGTTLDYHNPAIIDSTHIFVNHAGQATQGGWQTVFYNDSGPAKVFGVNAAACLISRAFIEAQPYADFFDESFFMYMEDVDVAARSTVMGWDNYLVPGAKALHMGSASSGGDAGFSALGLYLTFRNNLGMIIKNFPLKLVLRMIWHMPRADYRTVRHLYKLNRKAEAHKVIKGRLLSLIRIPIYLIKRSQLHSDREVDADYLWQLMIRGF